MSETIIIGGRTNKTTTTLKELLKKKEKEEFAIEELEKIKAEFEDKILLNQTVAIQILDNHIAELKGENK